MPREKVLILGGTREAAELAERLHRSGVCDVTTSLAGRTKTPDPLEGEVRIGGFGGAYGLADFIRQNGFARVIDATHPFAKTISGNAVTACEAAGVPLEIHTRPPWEKQLGDNWIEVSSLDAAASALPDGARAFLALGRQYLNAFKKRRDCHFVIRMVDAPESPLGLASYEIITGKPPQMAAQEEALMRRHQISHLVCRNSGGSAYAKIEVARHMKIPVIMIGR